MEALTNEQVFAAWKELLRNARVELTMLGSSDPQNAFRRFESYFSDSPRAFSEIPPALKTPAEVKRITEKEDLSQGKLVMGFRSAYFKNDRDCLANSVMSAVLGGTPTSKLFLNVREKESLCYYCVSRVDNNKGVMLIDSGVETENVGRTEESILRQLELLKKGELTDGELEEAKLAIKNSLISSLDSLAAMQGFYIGGILREGQMSPLEAAAAVDDITKDRVIELANAVQLDTVYALVGNRE